MSNCELNHFKTGFRIIMDANLKQVLDARLAGGEISSKEYDEVVRVIEAGVPDEVKNARGRMHVPINCDERSSFESPSRKTGSPGVLELISRVLRGLGIAVMRILCVVSTFVIFAIACVSALGIWSGPGPTSDLGVFAVLCPSALASLLLWVGTYIPRKEEPVFFLSAIIPFYVFVIFSLFAILMNSNELPRKDWDGFFSSVSWYILIGVLLGVTSFFRARFICSRRS